MTDAAELERLTFHPVTAGRWADFVALFEARGGPKNCWCMAWRGTAEERRSFTAAQGEQSGGRAKSSGLRKAAIERRISEDIPVGILAYDGTSPIAWCSIASRPTYRSLGGPKDFADRPKAVWSIACFFIARPWRGKGLGRRLIREAVGYARAEGARMVEAYPVEPDSGSYRFMGLVPVFAAEGFAPIGKAGTRRTVMRLALE